MARWAVITGEKGHHKADFALGVVARLRAAGVRVAGFVQRRRYDGDQKGHDLLRLATGERRVLAQGGVAAKAVSQEAFCTYAFRNDTFEQALAWLQADGREAEVLVLDDISKLEVQGRGHAASLAWALSQPEKVVVISARASQLFYVVENFGLDGDPVAAAELPVGEREQAEFAQAVVRMLRRSMVDSR